MGAQSRGAVIVFAKAPQTGNVKTRLCPPLTHAEAAAFYACMLGDVLELTSRACIASDLGLILSLHPFEMRSEIASWVPAQVRIVAQRGRDLSERMGWAVAEAAAGGCTRIVLRGSDSPLLSEQVLHDALSSLDRTDLAVSPDRDGGYSLLALRGPCPGLFDHPMSTSAVLKRTLANAASAGLRCLEVESGSDIDTIEDLRRLFDMRHTATARSRAPRSLDFAWRSDLWRFVAEPSEEVGQALPD